MTGALIAFDLASQQLLDADNTDRAAEIVAKLRNRFQAELEHLEQPRPQARPQARPA